MQEFSLQLFNLKLDLASPKSLTTTPSREEFLLCLLLTHNKEDLCLLRHLLTFKPPHR